MLISFSESPCFLALSLTSKPNTKIGDFDSVDADATTNTDCNANDSNNNAFFFMQILLTNIIN